MMNDICEFLQKMDYEVSTIRQWNEIIKVDKTFYQNRRKYPYKEKFIYNLENSVAKNKGDKL